MKCAVVSSPLGGLPPKCKQDLGRRALLAFDRTGQSKARRKGGCQLGGGMDGSASRLGMILIWDPLLGVTYKWIHEEDPHQTSRQVQERCFLLLAFLLVIQAPLHTLSVCCIAMLSMAGTECPFPRCSPFTSPVSSPFWVSKSGLVVALTDESSR